ncbi:hypothetical protein [Methyloversatilis thermotolerans]|uniref:hypothetical protein n=1 Tax=Methyloversatilis thermotolerans TaxID=1346290 RepID=UPI0003A22CB3|nr:hypothetical protein [Methyloversatilis thermotolerans]
MKFHRFPVAVATAAVLAFPGLASAHDYSTQTRVEFVLECMQSHGGAYEYLYKCSCLIDEISKTLKQDDFIDMSSINRYSQMGGERGGVFRDPENMKEAKKTYLDIVKKGEKACFINSR